MNLKDIWSNACAIMRRDNCDKKIIIESWIVNGVEPFSYEKNDFIIVAKAGIYFDTVNNMCMDIIRDAVQQLEGKNVNVILLTKEAAEKYKTTGMVDSVFEKSNLMEKYSFANFVVGPTNQFAQAAALAVAIDPGKAYSPLFIYGGVGLGKTHLMQAIGNYIVTNDMNKKVYYATSEQFTSEMIQSIQLNQNSQFRSKYRNVDVLIIDDIQFIAGREATQEEFFHTFNALQAAGKQIVLSSDRLPFEIPKLEERLRSRFSSGLAVDISRPDLDTRIAILREKAKFLTIDVEDDVIELIAEKIDSNIRELEGALSRLQAFANLIGKRKADAELAKTALKEIFDKNMPKALDPADVLRAVCQYFSVSKEEILGPKKNKSVSIPRQIFMYLARELTTASLPNIGNFLGGRDHTTIMHGCDKINSMKENDTQIKTALDDLKYRLS